MGSLLTFMLLAAAMLPALGHAQQCGELDPKCAPIMEASKAKIDRIGATIGRGDSMRSSSMKAACAAQVGVDAVEACIAVSSPSCRAILEAEKKNLMPTLRTAIEAVRKLSGDDDAHWEPDKAECGAAGRAGNAGLAGLLDSLDKAKAGLGTGDAAPKPEADEDAALQAEYEDLVRELESYEDQKSRLEKEHNRDRESASSIYESQIRGNNRRSKAMRPLWKERDARFKAANIREYSCLRKNASNREAQVPGISSNWAVSSDSASLRDYQRSDFIGSKGVSLATEWANFSWAQRVAIVRSMRDEMRDCYIPLKREYVAIYKDYGAKLRAVARTVN